MNNQLSIMVIDYTSGFYFFRSHMRFVLVFWCLNDCVGYIKVTEGGVLNYLSVNWSIIGGVIGGWGWFIL